MASFPRSIRRGLSWIVTPRIGVRVWLATESGTDVVVCGPGDITVAHTAREYIDLAELERGALAYALAFAKLLKP